MLIALHGFTEIDLSWKEVLHDIGTPLESPLLPGHGHRPCPPGTGPDSVVAELAERYRGAAPFDLLGYSMGGRIALQFALTHPQMLRRLILVSCRPGIRDDAGRAERAASDERLAQILEENGIGQFVAWWESNPALKSYRPMPRSMQEHLRSRRLNQDADGLAASLRAFGQGTTPSLWDRLGEIAIPTLAIAGSADTRYVEDMTAMVALMPQARMSVIPECGHPVHRECRDSLANIVRGFLATSPQATSTANSPL